MNVKFLNSRRKKPKHEPFIIWVASQDLYFPLVHHPQKVENWETPQNNKCGDEEPPLWLTYIGEKRRALGKGYRII
jgi:hypothetical protein